MNPPNLTLTKTTRDELGQQLGELNSTSETVQVSIVIGGLIIFSALWALTPIPNWVLFVGCPLTTSAANWFAQQSPHFRSSLQFFEYGIELVDKGEQNIFLYDSITAVSSSTRDHHHKGMYVGTKVEIEIQTKNPYRFLQYQCDFQRGGKKQSVIHQALDRCSQGAQKSLCAKLDEEGELLWMPGFFLTLEGLKLVDNAFDTTRTVLFEEIEDWKLNNNLLKIWKTGEGMPYVTVPSSTPNFAPHFALFCQMRNYFRQHDVVTAELVEAPETDQALVQG